MSKEPGAASAFHWPDGYRAAVCLTFDMDAESGVLFDHPETAAYLDVMTHQAYGPRSGVPRLLKILDRTDVRATFFIPGYSAEQWPDAARAIRDAGHEISHHGYLHERSRGASPSVLEQRLVRGLEALDQVLGVRPVGYRSPLWQMSYEMPAILIKHGFKYDVGLMDSDRPYRLAAGPEAGSPSMIELGSHWSLDDGLAYDFLPDLWGSGVISSPSALMERWKLDFDATAQEGGLFVPTIHPYISGRPSRAAALEKLIEHFKLSGGVWIATCGKIAAHVDALDLEPVVHLPPVLPA